jgi:hypothetical protein
MPAEAYNRVMPGSNKSALYHVLDPLNSKNLHACRPGVGEAETSGRTAIKTSFLLLNRVYAMLRQFPIGTLTHPRLLSHRFSANTILTGLANAAVKGQRWLGANHAFPLYLAHDRLFYSTGIHCQ